MTTSVFAAAVAQAVAGWLLTYAIHSTILLGVASLLAVRLREQHAWLDWIWKLALVGAIVTTTAQSALGVHPLGGRWSPWPIAAASGAQERVAQVPAVRGDGAPGADAEAASLPSDPGQAGVSERLSGGRARAAAECCASDALRRGPRAPGLLDSLGAFSRNAIGLVKGFWPSVLVGVWFLLALIGMVRFAVRQRALYRMLGPRRLLHDAQLSRTLGELCAAAGLRRPVRLTVAPRCVVPVALLGREIAVPERFLTDLDREQQHAALAHEVAHQTRRDPQWLLLAFLLETIFWFQPLQRRARGALRDNAEVICDDWAVEQLHSLGVARCLNTVAEWVSPAPQWRLTAASWMAWDNAALAKRVERLYRAERVRPARRSLALATLLSLPLLLLVAPVVSSADIPASAVFRIRPPAPSVTLPTDEAQVTARPPQEHPARPAAQDDGVIRAPRSADPLEARWAWALEEAVRRRLSGFWIVYSYSRPTSSDQQFMSDSHSTDQLIGMKRLGALLGETDTLHATGSIGALFHFTGPDDRRIDRIGHRSLSLGVDFAAEPVFWLGHAAEAQSLTRLERMFDVMTAPELLEEIVEAYGLHPTTDRVLPFLARALQPDMLEAVRGEAAESLDKHPDPRVVPLLVRTVRTDASVHVRAEAVEALGELRVPEAIPALLDLARNAGDTWTRREAAEALGDQTPALALPALLSLIASSTDARVQLEAVDALGELQTKEVVDALVQLIWEHEAPDVRREAVEVLAEYRGFGVLEHLDSILTAHTDELVLDEALDVLASLSDPRAEQRIARVALTSPSPLIRREALELLGEAQERTDKRAITLSAEQLTLLLERAIFDDPDRSVQLEALAVAAESLPGSRARELLRRVADEHSVRGIRTEALNLLDDAG